MQHQKAAGIKKYAKAMGNVVSALSIVYVLAALVHTDPAVCESLDGWLFLPVFTGSIACKAMTVWMSAGAWRLWLEFYAKKQCSRQEAFHVYAKANIGKYLPGNVMHYVERNLFAGKLGLSQRQIAAASASEVISLVLAAFLVGTLFAYGQIREVFQVLLEKLPFLRMLWEKFSVTRVSDAGFPDAESILRMVGWGLAFAVILLLCQAACHTWNKQFWNTFLCSLAVYAAVLTMLGMLLVPVCWCLGKKPDLKQALQMITAYVIAWVFGFVVPGAPGGIGVREMALTLLLEPVAGRDQILVLGVLHRLITIAGDFLVYLLWGARR